MIKSFIFDNFKGYDYSELWLEQITTLIGSNASGKSNAIEGIQILSELATGRDVNVIFDGTKNGESSIRGGAKGCCRFSSNSFTLGCVIDWNETSDLLYRITISTDTKVFVKVESLYSVKKSQTNAKNGTLIFKTINSSSKSGNNEVQYSKASYKECSVLNNMSALSQMKSRIPPDTENYDETIKKISHVQTSLRNIFVLDPTTSLMRNYSRIGESTLRRNCSNLSAVLYSIRENSPNEWEAFRKIVESLPENEIKGIDFVKTQINDVILIQKEKNNKSTESIDAARLSDGTLRCIATLAAVISEPENSVIAIEEIDNGIHPSRVIKLMKAICDIAGRRNIDLVLTTHNVTLLNGLTKQNLLGVSVVYRDSELQASKIIPFVEISNYSGILINGGIGSAMETDQLTNSIKNIVPFTPFIFDNELEDSNE